MPNFTVIWETDISAADPLEAVKTAANNLTSATVIDGDNKANKWSIDLASGIVEEL